MTKANVNKTDRYTSEVMRLGGYTMVHRRLLEDPDIDWRTKHLLIGIISEGSPEIVRLDDDKVFGATISRRKLQEKLRLSRDTINRGLDELRVKEILMIDERDIREEKHFRVAIQSIDVMYSDLADPKKGAPVLWDYQNSLLRHGGWFPLTNLIVNDTNKALTALARMAYVCYVRFGHKGKNATCIGWPGQDRIAKMLGLKHGFCVQRAIYRLVNMGLISQKDRKGTTPITTIPWPRDKYPNEIQKLEDALRNKARNKGLRGTNSCTP